ncbi:MAG: DUF1273 family protein [Clostridia bacterium]|nr:DUF1273 family protein [Clostridia bacterium]
MKENKKQYTVCFTGHRQIPSGEYETLAARLREVVARLIERGFCYFGVGGALGFDTLAAETVLDFKEKYPYIKLILVLPCRDQTRYWSDHDKERYEHICSRADKVTCFYDKYRRGCMHERNRHLVDHSSVCVCYLTHYGGGTDYTVSYAEKLGVEIINLAL